MGLIAKLLPTAVIQEDMMGDKEKGEDNQRDITIRLVSQVAEDPALPPREVQGELVYDETTKH